MPNFFLRGLIIGLSIAAPVGPIGILVIRRTLINGQLSGFISGLGAATADAIYGSIAGLGLTLISSFLIKQQMWLGLIGGIFLCYLGLKTLLTITSSPIKAITYSESKNPESERKYALIAAIHSNRLSRDYLADYGSTLFLTLTNPMTILSFTAIFAGLGLTSNNGNLMLAFSLIAGVFVGSTIWWLCLSSFANFFRLRAFNSNSFLWINRISGLIILGFGLVAIILALKDS